ncbi:MAG: hypothetical protein CND00_02890 [Cryomorphaceae bacterium MED-G14]|nr:MAG: hypothetical protein CND00_02890 [Cryomorphaceae bacterium MED-G14]
MKKIYLSAILALFILQYNNSQSANDTIPIQDLDEVVVSTPFKETVKNNVIKVSKLRLSDLSMINAQNFKFSLLKVPGLSIVSTGPYISKPSIRGMYGNRVVTYANNMRLENQQWGDDHGLEIDAFGTESIEVIKGPLSVLYGSDAIGGVIYISPDNYISDGFEVEFGSYYNSNYSGLTNNLGIKGGSGKFSYIIQGSLVDNGDFENADGVVEGTFFESTDIKAGLGFSSEKFISDLRFSHSSIKVGVPHGDEHDEDNHDEHGDDDDHDDDHEDKEESYQNLTNTMISLKNNILFERSELEITLGYSENNRKEFGHHDEEGHDDDDEDGDYDDDHEGEAHLDMDLSTTTVDLKYIFPKNNKSEFIIGTNIVNQENTNLGEDELVPNATKNDLGIYGLTHIHGEVWDVMLGFRTDFRKIKASSFNENYSSLNATVGLKRDLGNEGLMRINLSRGFRAPNLSELFSEGIHHATGRYEQGDKNLSTESNLQVDFSIMTFSEKSKFELDLFYNKINDYIYINPTDSYVDNYQVYKYIQKDANLFGGEISYKRETPLEWLSHETSIEFISGKTAERENLPLIAPITLNHSFGFDFNNSSLEIGALFKGKKQNIGQFETKTDSYLLVNLSGSHDLNLLNNNLTLGWSINNLFDKEYYDHLSRLKNFSIHEMGRNISVGLNYTF